jgi:hypothetical protein
VSAGMNVKVWQNTPPDNITGPTNVDAIVFNPVVRFRLTFNRSLQQLLQKHHFLHGKKPGRFDLVEIDTG